jgi:hypothetical protein
MGNLRCRYTENEGTSSYDKCVLELEHTGKHKLVRIRNDVALGHGIPPKTPLVVNAVPLSDKELESLRAVHSQLDGQVGLTNLELRLMATIEDYSKHRRRLPTLVGR